MDFELKFLRYTNPVVAGSLGTVTVSLRPTSPRAEPASGAIDVHFGFQGSYSWGDFPYTESVEKVVLPEAPSSQVGVIEVSATLEIPYKNLIELDCYHFSYFVYFTPEGGRWTLEAPMVVSGPVEVKAPKTVTKEEVNALIAQLKWEVENSALSNEVKEGLAANFEVQIEAVVKLEEPSTPRRVREKLESFVEELASGRAGRYADAKLWTKQTRFIISRLQKLQAAKALEQVPADTTFRFYIGIGQYTGVSAESLGDFLEKVATIDVRALEFHVSRKDFENWVTDILGDDELAGKLAGIREKGYSGEDLRCTVSSILRQRYAELEGLVALGENGIARTTP